jgi:hypothetical protein
MSDHDLLDAFTTFFDDLPDAVRTEISFVLVTLAHDGAVETESVIDYEQAARGLFGGETQFGRLGNLISAAAVIDVYFAGDPRGRFAPVLSELEQLQADQRGNPLRLVRDRYVERLEAVEGARRHWLELRRTVLAPAAIGAALIPGSVPDTRRSDAGRVSRA